MNEENNSQPQENTGFDNPNEEEREAHSPRVFDISSDNITPFKEESEEITKTVTTGYISTIKPLPAKPPEKDPFEGLPETPHLVNLITKDQPKPVPTQPVPSQPPLKEPLFQTSLNQQNTLPRSPALQPTPTVAGGVSTDTRAHPEIPLDPNIKPLRTYEDDVAEVLARQKASAASIALAESRKKEGSDTIKNRPVSTSHAGRNIFLTLLSFVMLGGGAFAAYYLYLSSPVAPVRPSERQPVASSIIPVDSRSSIIVDGLTRNQILDRISEEVRRSQPIATIREIIPTTAKNNIILRIAGPDMLKMMDIAPPDVLFRSLTPEWMLGTYALANGEISTFVIATTDFFQNTFAGMLQWERVMADDLKQFLYPITPIGIANIDDVNLAPRSASTSTATSTALTPKPVPIVAIGAISGRFEDKIVHNKDVRAFRTDDGKILFMYSFLDNTKLVITNNEATLSEILTRLEKQAFVR